MGVVVGEHAAGGVAGPGCERAIGIELFDQTALAVQGELRLEAQRIGDGADGAADDEVVEALEGDGDDVADAGAAGIAPGGLTDLLVAVVLPGVDERALRVAGDMVGVAGADDERPRAVVGVGDDLETSCVSRAEDRRH